MAAPRVRRADGAAPAGAADRGSGAAEESGGGAPGLVGGDAGESPLVPTLRSRGTLGGHSGSVVSCAYSARRGGRMLTSDNAWLRLFAADGRLVKRAPLPPGSTTTCLAYDDKHDVFLGVRNGLDVVAFAAPTLAQQSIHLCAKRPVLCATFFSPLSRYILAGVEGIAIWEVVSTARAYGADEARRAELERATSPGRRADGAAPLGRSADCGDGGDCEGGGSARGPARAASPTDGEPQRSLLMCDSGGSGDDGVMIFGSRHSVLGGDATAKFRRQQRAKGGAGDGGSAGCHSHRDDAALEESAASRGRRGRGRRGGGSGGSGNALACGVELRHALHHGDGWVTCLHADETTSQLFAAVGCDVQVWSIAHGTLAYELRALHDLPITSVIYCAVPKHIVTASADRSIRVWDFHKNALALVDTLLGHTRRVVALQEETESRTLLSVGDDGVVRRWCVETATCWDALRIAQPTICDHPSSAGRPGTASAAVSAMAPAPPGPVAMIFWSFAAGATTTEGNAGSSRGRLGRDGPAPKARSGGEGASADRAAGDRGSGDERGGAARAADAVGAGSTKTAADEEGRARGSRMLCVSVADAVKLVEVPNFAVSLARCTDPIVALQVLPVDADDRRRDRDGSGNGLSRGARGARREACTLGGVHRMDATQTNADAAIVASAAAEAAASESARAASDAASSGGKGTAGRTGSATLRAPRRHSEQLGGGKAASLGGARPKTELAVLTRGSTLQFLDASLGNVTKVLSPSPCEAKAANAIATSSSPRVGAAGNALSMSEITAMLVVRKQNKLVTGWANGAVEVHNLSTGVRAHSLGGRTDVEGPVTCFAFVPSMAEATSNRMRRRRSTMRPGASFMQAAHDKAREMATLNTKGTGAKRQVRADEKAAASGRGAAAKIAGALAPACGGGATGRSKGAAAPWAAFLMARRWRKAHNDPHVVCGYGTGQFVIVPVLTQKTSERPRRVQAHAQAIIGLWYIRERKLVASVGMEGAIKLWDMGDLTLRASFATAPSHAAITAVSLRGAFEAVCGLDDGTIEVWSLVCRPELLDRTTAAADPGSDILSRGTTPHAGGVDPEAVLREHTQHVTALAMADNERFFASSSLDCSVILWHTASRTALHTFSFREPVANMCALSSDFDLLVCIGTSLCSVDTQAHQVAPGTEADDEFGAAAAVPVAATAGAGAGGRIGRGDGDATAGEERHIASAEPLPVAVGPLAGGAVSSSAGESGAASGVQLLLPARPTSAATYADPVYVQSAQSCAPFERSPRPAVGTRRHAIRFMAAHADHSKPKDCSRRHSFVRKDPVLDSLPHSVLAYRAAAEASGVDADQALADANIDMDNADMSLARLRATHGLDSDMAKLAHKESELSHLNKALIIPQGAMTYMAQIGSPSARLTSKRALCRHTTAPMHPRLADQLL